MNRRAFLGGLIATLAAPAIIRTPGLLMPVKPIIVDAKVFLAPPMGAGTWFQILGRDQFGEMMMERIFAPDGQFAITPKPMRELVGIVADSGRRLTNWNAMYGHEIVAGPTERQVLQIDGVTVNMPARSLIAVQQPMVRWSRVEDPNSWGDA